MLSGQLTACMMVCMRLCNAKWSTYGLHDGVNEAV